MPIPARQLVSVNPRVISAGGTDLVINGLVLSQSKLIPLSSLVLQFSDADSVGEYFGTTSDEYAYASVYFLGYKDSFKKPTNFMVAKRVKDAEAAWIRGGKYTGTLAALQAVTTGAMSITINGTAVAVTALSFASCTSFSAVAAALETALATALTGTTCSYSSLTGAFTISSGNAGASSTITYATTPTSGTDLSALLNLTSATGAVLSQGSDALAATENMTQIINKTANWVTFSTIYEADATEISALAAWATAQGVEYLYLPWSTDALLIAQGSTTSISDVLQAAGVSSTSLQYFSDYKLSAFISGMWASVDWDRLNGTITSAFKGQSGLAYNVNDGNTASLLIAKQANFYGNYATRNDQFVNYYPGRMFGDYTFIDPYINAVWLDNAIQVSLMTALQTYPRIPYTERGYTLIRAALMDPVKRAKRNGVIEPGVTLSEQQKAELTSEYGSSDIIQELNNNGYCIKIDDAGASVRVNRTSPTISLHYTYGGSVQQIVIAATAVL